MSRTTSQLLILAVLTFCTSVVAQQRVISGTIVTKSGELVPNAKVLASFPGGTADTSSDGAGRFTLSTPDVQVRLVVKGVNIPEVTRTIAKADRATGLVIEVEYKIATVRESLVITATVVDPAIERRNDAVYQKTLFNRDDQIFDTLAAGINAGQHEGGGKSIEVRRFGYNLDHGGVSGGLKVLVDNIQQNQNTQGHGQGYLGGLKSLTPELVQDVDILNGPFSAEYGDFSGLGVVHIRQKERLNDRVSLRLQGGSFGAMRTFLAYSPRWEKADAFVAYEGARSDGPFLNPLGYKRDNFTTNYTRRLSGGKTLGLRLNGARNDFDSSGQLPIDEIAAGRLDRFGALDPHNGGKNQNSTAGVYFKNDFASGDILRVDGFVSRNLFDLWSNFTFYLNDPVNGDEFLQHDSRLQNGANVQWLHSWKFFGNPALLTSGANYHDNRINVGLFHTVDRVILAPQTHANAHVTNGAWYAQQAFDFAKPHVHLDFGLRYDVFRFGVRDRLATDVNGAEVSGRFQPKLNLTWTPSQRVPVNLHASYGRGISSQDARGVVQYPAGTKLATTDFYQLGTSTSLKRVSLSADLFIIDRSNEQVYVADDGSIEFKGPSRSYGWEAKTSVQLTSRLSWNAGLTQVSNAFYRGSSPREYVDSAPHTVANSGLTLSGWRGLYTSLRFRHVSGYIVDPLDRSERATGADVVDLAVTKSLRRGLELNFAVDNLTNHRYYETQNWFESRIRPNDPAVTRIHATPGYPVGFMVGLTFRLE